MDLYLMQHGVAVPESEDPDRPLSVEGRSQIEASAVAMKKLRLSFDLIIATPRKRSRETAEIIAAAVGYPAESIMISDTLLPAAPPERALDALDQFESSHKIFIAGHLPALASLAACPLSYLAMRQWLEAFAYRVDLGVVTFAGVAFGILALATLTTGSQALKGALLNPVEVLRHE